MKTKLTKIMLLILIVTMTVLALVACADKSFTIKVMDGETEVGTFTVKQGDKLTEDNVLAKLNKEGYTFGGLYSDEECTKPFVYSDEIIDSTTLYVKYTKKLIYISVITGEGESKVEKISVVDGQEYSVPAPTKEGYDFAYYTYVDDNDEEQRFPQTGTFKGSENVRLTAHWTKQMLTVTFKAVDQNDTVLATQTGIEYGAKASAITLTGYTVNGYYLAKEFTEENKINLATYEVKAATTIYVDKTANSYKLNLTGYGDIDVTYDAVYTLPNPDKASETNPDYLAWLNEKVGTTDTHEWTELKGYKRGNEAFPYTGVYKIVGNAVITPDVTDNPAYNKATVTFFDGVSHSQMGSSVTLTKGQNLNAIEGSFPATAKTGYTFGGWFTSATYESDTAFTLNTAVDSNTAVYAKYTANKYTVTVKDTNADGAVLKTVEVFFGSALNLTNPGKFGYTFLRYLNGTEEFDPAAHTPYDIADNLVLFAIFEADAASNENFIADAENNYFKERATAEDAWTYVFLTGAHYNFTGYTLASTAHGHYININGSAFDATAPGEFTLELSSVSSSSKTYVNAKVVYDVNDVSFGSDFSGMLANAQSSSSFNTTIAAEEDYVMDMGEKNFKPDVVIKNNNYDDITMEQANVVIEMTKGGNAFAGAYAVSGSTVDFTIGNDYFEAPEVVTLVIKPKYVFDNSSETLKVRFNKGVNVYTNSELIAEYGRLSNQCVNVLRNIKAELPQSEYVSGYGTTGNIKLYKDTNMKEEESYTLENWDLGIPHNWYGGGVYRRTTNNKSDNMVVNGNYFSIDGSKLPFVADYSSRTEKGGPYTIMESQIGIFLYRCCDIDYTGNKRDINRRYADGTITINNLKIVGNNKTELSTYLEPVEDKNPLLKMSAAFEGVVLRGGTMNLNNTTITNTSMGIMMDGGVSGYGGSGVFMPGATEGWVYDKNETQSCHLNMNGSLLDKNWQFHLYVYNLGAVSLAKTKIGQCSGAAIAYDDLAYANPENANYENTEGYSNLSSTLTMDIATATGVQNFVSGSEAWFAAYGKAPYATAIKKNVEGGVSGNGLTILNNKDQFNFVVLVMPSGGGTWASDIHGHPYVEFQKFSHEMVTDNSLTFPYGTDAEKEAYEDYIGDDVESPNFGAALTTGAKCYFETYVPALTMYVYISVYFPGDPVLAA